MSLTHRRIVTGHDANRRAVVISDASAPDVQKHENLGVTVANFWQTFEAPARFDEPSETVDGPVSLHPPKNGSVFRFVTFEPEDPNLLGKLDGQSAFSAVGGAANVVADARHPLMHRTDSVDYAVVLSGKIALLLDDSEVVVGPGDVVIQRGTNHAWSNRFEAPCTIAFVLIDGDGKI